MPWSILDILVYVKARRGARERSNPKQNPKNPKTLTTSKRKWTYLIETLSPRPTTYRFGILKS